MKGLEVDFKFHNVGQGLFYTGRLKYGRASFNFVYDCGSEKTSLVKDAINREFQPDEKIDLLIVSHLHKDHTSGIPYLFKRVNNVDTVILPYLSPLERLVVALMAPRASQEYYHFLADPVAYSLEHGVRRVVLVGGEEADRRENWIPSFRGSPEIPPEEVEFELVNELPYDENLQLQILNSEEELVALIDGGAVEVRNHLGILNVALGGFPIWLFRFFNYRVSLQALNQFESCVNKILGRTDSRTLKNAIVNKSQRDDLKDCYKRLSRRLKNFNNTSLMVLHLPAFRQYIMDYECEWSWQLCCSLCSECWPCYSPFERRFRIVPSNFVQFLTGDINLKYKFNEISQHFGLGTAIRNTVATLIPHHGSHKNWNNALCSSISSITSNFWVVSAGIHNKYGHPSHQVLLDVCANCWTPCVVWVNEAMYFRLMGTLQF